MKKATNPLIYVLAGVGLAVLIYGGWTIYQRHVSDETARASFSASPIPGSPDFLGAKPQPPPQP
jgi:hypothetical protein